MAGKILKFIFGLLSVCLFPLTLSYLYVFGYQKFKKIRESEFGKLTKKAGVQAGLDYLEVTPSNFAQYLNAGAKLASGK